ncbi:MAG: hypothetical protein F4X99_18570 [Gammaproteobacteria bacterium]|nr:hypothetical protein [Gammaproteobacteria bacterium]
MTAKPPPPERLGAVGRHDDGSTVVRFERELAFPVDTVWRAITDPDLLASWFPGFAFEAERGGRYTIHFGGDCAGPADVEGPVVAYDPPNVLQCGTIRWELEAADASCRLTFSDVLQFQDGRSATEIANAVLGGWHRYLDLLEQSLSDTPDLDTPEPDYSRLDVPGRPGGRT